VARLGPVDAREFHARVFTASNALFFATGDLTASEILRKVEAGFGDWPTGEIPEEGPAPPAPAPPERRIVLVDRPDLGQAQILVGHEGISRTDPERLPASLMNAVLGGDPFSSRLMTRVRAEEGLTYSVASYFAMRRHPGPFAVSTFTRIPKVRRVIDLLLAELARMRSEPPSPEEVMSAQSQTVGEFSLGLETSSAVVNALADLDVHGLPADSLDTFRGRIRALTAEDTARAARDLVHPERAAIVLVGPAEAILPQLQDLGAVEVVQP
jgi:zinc protease